MSQNSNVHIIIGKDKLQKRSNQDTTSVQLMTMLKQQLLFSILLKEDFRSFLISKEPCSDYYLDSDDFVSIPLSVGCFRRGDSWTVYETDERGTAINVQSFNNALDAFRDSASRRDLVYNPKKDVLSTKSKAITIQQLKKEINLVEGALKTLSKIDQMHSITNHPDSLKKDITILNDALLEDKINSILRDNLIYETLLRERNKAFWNGFDIKDAVIDNVRVNKNGSGSITIKDRYIDNVARALVKIKPELRSDFKAAGLLTRDPRMKERKKNGLKAARRAPQFSKR